MTHLSKRIGVDIYHPGAFVVTKTTSVDGFELSYQSNFLSPFLLTTLLLQRNAFAPNARIIQTSSLAAFSLVGDFTPSTLNSRDIIGKEKEGDLGRIDKMFMIYGRAKALQVLWSDMLQERLAKTEAWKDVVVQSYHPGELSASFRNATVFPAQQTRWSEWFGLQGGS